MKAATKAPNLIVKVGRREGGSEGVREGGYSISLVLSYLGLQTPKT